MARHIFYGRNSQQARRMRHLRQQLGGESGPRFAARVGLTYTRWHNYESGYPITIEAAMSIVEHIEGMTLDYLYYGKTNGLSPELRTLLTRD